MVEKRTPEFREMVRMRVVFTVPGPERSEGPCRQRGLVVIILPLGRGSLRF